MELLKGIVSAVRLRHAEKNINGAKKTYTIDEKINYII